MNPYETTVRTFDELASQYEEKYLDAALYWPSYDAFAERVDASDAKILDVACGPGNISRYLLRKHPAWRVLGIDLAPQMSELARQNNPTARFQVMDARRVDQIEERFDGIVIGFCLPYLTRADAHQLIVDTRALLEPGGVLSLSFIEGDPAHEGLQTSASGHQVYQYFHQRDDLIELLREEGLRIESVQCQESPNPGDSPTQDVCVIVKHDT